MNAADAERLLSELAHINEQLERGKDIQGDGISFRPTSKKCNIVIDGFSFPVADRMALMHMESHLYSLEVRRDAIKAQLNID